jgi:putative tRNA adenosine deaminase-associated protein
VQPSDAGAIAVVSVDEDFFVAVRVHGTEERVLLSDVTAALDWPLAREAVEHAGLPMPDEDDDLDGVVPAGDLNLFADLGTDAAEIDLICADLELLPDEALGRIATKAGFGDKFDLALESLPD